MNRSSKLSDKQQLFKIKSKASKQHSQVLSTGLELPPIANPSNLGNGEPRPVYEKLFIADAMSKVTSFCQFHHQERLS